MTLVDDLAKHGLSASGNPPAVQASIAGISVPVSATESEQAVQLRASLLLSGPSEQQDLVGVSLGAAGDASFGIAGTELFGVRTLIQPTLGELYDAIFELAKATVSTARLLEELEQFRAQLGDSGLSVPASGGDAGWAATHVVPPEGIRTWPMPDPNSAEGPTLSAGLPVQVLERRDTWAHIKCSNSWTAWVDARQLQAQKV